MNKNSTKLRMQAVCAALTGLLANPELVKSKVIDPGDLELIAHDAVDLGDAVIRRLQKPPEDV